MSPALIGGVVGVVVGLVNFGALRAVADRLEDQPSASGTAARVRAVRAVAWADIVIFPVLGYVVGPMVLS